MDCDFVAEGKTDEEIVQKAKEHGVKSHNMQVTPELESKIRGMIKNA
jgi:predicted small metal-binding protein